MGWPSPRNKGIGISSPTAESYGIAVLTMNLFPKRKRQLMPNLPSDGNHLAVGDTTRAYIFLLSSWLIMTLSPLWWLYKLWKGDVHHKTLFISSLSHYLLRVFYIPGGFLARFLNHPTVCLSVITPTFSGRWLQPISKILVKLDHFPK